MHAALQNPLSIKNPEQYGVRLSSLFLLKWTKTETLTKEASYKQEGRRRGVGDSPWNQTQRIKSGRGGCMLICWTQQLVYIILSCNKAKILSIAHAYRHAEWKQFLHNLVNFETHAIIIVWWNQSSATGCIIFNRTWLSKPLPEWSYSVNQDSQSIRNSFFDIAIHRCSYVLTSEMIPCTLCNQLPCLCSLLFCMHACYNPSDFYIVGYTQLQ